jgi:hypothetical protein
LIESLDERDPVSGMEAGKIPERNMKGRLSKANVEEREAKM